MSDLNRKTLDTSATRGSVLTKISCCRSCGSEELSGVFDLGAQPFANALLRHPGQAEEHYPLELAICGACGLCQLLHTADPAALFSQYVWVTGTSSTAREHAERFCVEALNRLPDGKANSYVLEIASNDGTFLKPFIDRGVSVLGVDPAANIAQEANNLGIRTRCAFFGADEALSIRDEYGHPSLVIARNVLPHVANPLEFVRGVAELVGEHGLAAIEFHDGWDIHRDLQYDSIYHEHLCYFTVTTLTTLLSKVSLELVDLGTSPISGGSLIAFVRRRGAAVSPSVVARISMEGETGINTAAAWRQFGHRAVSHAKQLRELVEGELRFGVIAGYGASARSSTMLNFAGINHEHLTAIADQNPLKHGRYTPGTHIPILPPEDVFAVQPAAVLLLAWNFRREIESILRQRLRFGGKLIMPLPENPSIKSI